jgi:hypothetical protein
MRRLDAPVALMREKRDQDLTVGCEVIDDQDGRDARPPM